MSSTFEEWVALFGKIYSSAEEEASRRSIWESERSKIEAHNARYAAGESTYFLKLNAFSDLSDEEWRSRFLMSPSYVEKSKLTRRRRDEDPATAGTPWRFEHLQVGGSQDQEDGLASSFVDWRADGMVGAVQDQGSCGSCWAFAGVGAAASTVAIKSVGVGGAGSTTARTIRRSSTTTTTTSDEYVLGSVQEVLDCCPYGNATYDCWSCDGGEPVSMMGWLAQESHGFDSQTDWPYASGACAGGSCFACDEAKLDDPASDVMRIDGGERPPSDNETALMQALLARPVSIDIDVEGTFRSYGGGVFTDADCGETIWHAVLLVGFNYTGTNATDATSVATATAAAAADAADTASLGEAEGDAPSYFIMQNSWGESWGDGGYMYMGMGIDSPHGVCCLACYPAIALLGDD